jgi:hypothetical protein
MSKGLVVHLEDDLHRRFAMMCAYEGMTLKDELYELIKGAVESFEEFLKKEGKKESRS